MPKPLYIFDFDDTLALTNSTVVIQKADGQEIELNSREFAKYREEPGDKLDFSGFLSVPGGALIRSTVEQMENAISQHGIRSVYIVTARSLPSKESVRKFLSDNGVTVPRIVTTAGSAGKADWLRSVLITGDYDSVYVFEDCTKNIDMLGTVVEEFNQEFENLGYSGVSYHPTCIVESIVRGFVRKLLMEKFNARW
tara:strand:- start:374 stop:961 length:588 start_codon:yes stop_codon:yes gene_type:complete